jgi:hypothetical protein
MSKTTTDETFNELKTEAIKIWKTYDDTYGYATEKINYLNSFGNVKDNYGTIIGMFDNTNQSKLYKAVGDDAKALIRDWTGGYVSE